MRSKAEKLQGCVGSLLAAAMLTSEEARQQAQAEELTLLVADNKAGYFGVKLQAGAKPYLARVRHGGKSVSLGSYATAEEAALCVARSPEGQAAAAKAEAAALPTSPLTSEAARQQARAEGLKLRVADNKSGYFGVYHQPGRTKPFKAQVRRSGKDVSLGTFATAEEAALCFARSPEGQAVAEKAAAAPPLTSEETRQQARAEGLTLRVAKNGSGYFGVYLSNPGQPKPYQAHVWRGGKDVHLGSFVAAEEAALCVARTPERRAAAEKAAAAPVPLTSEEARQQAQAEGLTLLVTKNKAGYFGVNLDDRPGQPNPYQVRLRRGGKQVSLGSFTTAEEAALCVARTPEGQAAAQRATAAPVLLMSEETRQQAQAEGLSLPVGRSGRGYLGVYHKPNKSKPYEASAWRGGKDVHLGSFVTAEEAALCVARSPEAQEAAKKAAAAPPLTGGDDGGDDTGEESEEEIVEVLDAVEVVAASDDGGDDEALAMEAEGVTLVVERKRARESKID